MPTAQGDAEQFTCAYADAPLSDPAPDYLYPGTYDSNGNPYDGPSGCSVDGQPLPCSVLLRAGPGGGTIRFRSHDDWRGSESQLRPHGIFALYIPQSRAGQIPFDKDGIRDLLQKTVEKPGCKNFLKKLFDTLNKNIKRNPVAEGGDIMALYQGVLNSQKGGLSRERTKGSFGHGGAEGNIRKGTAVVFPGRGDPDFSPETQLLHDTMGVLNELPHVAGTKDLYSDRDLAEAAFDVTGMRQLQITSERSIQFPGNADFSLRKEAMKDVNHPSWGNYFHNLLRQKCPVTQEKKP